jgi:hypothetical protein
MKKIYILIIIVSALSIVAFQPPSQANAATNNNNLIDDFTFNNTNTLTASQIDIWLNSNFPSSCISSNSGFSAPDPIGYSPNYPHADGKYLYGSPVTAGKVIYDAAVAHGLNPQILITKLQNEEQLIDGSAGCGSTWRYASAVGFACTDSDTFSHNYSYTGADPFSDSSALATPIYYRNGTAINSITGSCVNHNVYAGFSEQVFHAAWALSIWQHKSEGQTGWAAITGNWNHCDDINSCPANMNIPAGWACYGGLMTQGNLKRCPTDSTTTYYDGYATIDGQALHMDNGATAALYVYTPHIQSFDNIFNAYFGSQYANDSFTPHPNGTLVASGDTKVYMIENNTKRWVMNGYVFDSYNFQWSQLKTATTGDNNLPVGSNYGSLAPGTIFRSDNTPIYIMTYDNGSLVKQQISYTAFNGLGYKWEEVLYVPPAIVPSATASNILFDLQHPAGTLVSGGGKVYLLDQTSKKWILGPNSFVTNNFNWNKVKQATSADLSLPDGANVDLRQGAMLYSGGGIYVVDYDGSGILKRPVGPWECFSNRWHYTVNDLSTISSPGLPARTGSLATC